MKFPFTFFIISVLLITGCQTRLKQSEFMQWKIGTALPPANGVDISIGVAGPVTGFYNDYLLVGGGANFPYSKPWDGGIKEYHDEAFLFQKDQDKLSVYKKNFKLPYPLAYAASCSTPKGIVVAGGENASGTTANAWLISWVNTPDSLLIKTLPDIPVALTSASAVAIGNKIYLVGGETAQITSESVFFLDLDQPIYSWKTLQSVPVPVSHAVLVSNDSILYLAGGKKKNEDGISTLYSTLYSYNPGQDSWAQEEDLPYALSAGTGISLNQQIILFGGNDGEIFGETERYIAAINNEKNEARRSLLTKKKNELQQSHPGFCKDILVYDIALKHWRKAGVFPFETPVTTTAVQMGEDIILPSGETKPGVRSPNIIIGKPVEPNMQQQ